MRALLSLTLALSSCATATQTDACGPPPLYPGLTVLFDGDRAIVSKTDWVALQSYHDEVVMWAACIDPDAPK